MKEFDRLLLEWACRFGNERVCVPEGFSIGGGVGIDHWLRVFERGCIEELYICSGFSSGMMTELPEPLSIRYSGKVYNTRTFIEELLHGKAQVS